MTEDGPLIPIPSPGVPLWFGDRARPVVVMLHDRFGRLPWLVPYAEALASRGGVHVAVPDLYGGVCTIDDGTADALAAELSPEQAGGLVDDCLAEGGSGGRAEAIPHAAVGFGWGGLLALRTAQRGVLDAVVAYDAALGDDDGAIIPCPVLLHRGAADASDRDAAARVAAFVGRLRDDGTSVVEHDYEARAGFANASMRERFSANAAALAFARTTAFLERQFAS